MHEQVRRARHERAGHDVAAAAPVAPLLALQRSAGNRAVQRLVWDGNTNIAHVPEGYWNQTVPFDLKKGELKPDDAAPTGKDPKLSEILERHPKLLAGVAHGFNVPYIQSMKPESDPKLEDRGRAATKDTDARLLQQIADAARSHNRIALIDPTEETTTANVGAKTPFVLRPTDYFAQKPDLPKAGTPLKKTNVPGKGKLTYYHYTCVLIALVIDGGMAKAKELAKEIGEAANVTDTPTAVQALHNYYRTNNRQYDDSSERFPIMADWGYNLIFSGESNWMTLGQQIELKAGSYIFDIPGHTMRVTVHQDVPKDMPKRAQFKTYFAPESDKDNYALGDEHTKPVRYIWKK